MDLLLTHGYFLYDDPKELQIMKPYAPLGLLYLASHLRRKGFGVEVFDSTFSSLEELQKVLDSTPPAVLGVYANLMTRPNVLKILRAAKEAGWTTVVGGPEPLAYVEEYLSAGADFVVIGEGEITLEELLSALKAGGKVCVQKINGIAYLDENGTVQRTSPRAQIATLDDRPWPEREAVRIENYLEVWRQHHGTGSVSLITARGCPYHCRWCSHAVYGKTHRRRSPGSVVDELDWILNRYHPDLLWMADDVFTIHHGWLQQYASELKRRGIRIPFECITRADRVNEHVAETLAEIGCFRVWIGSESGSQRILDAMERGVTVEQVQRATRLLKSRGIQTGMFLMWGYEGEGPEDIEATVEHVKVSDPDVFLTTVAYPIKGTPYFETVAPRVVETREWAQSSDREFTIRGRHSRKYYQFADQLLRSEVGLHRAMRSSGANGDDASVHEWQMKIASARDGLRAAFSEAEA
jgi:radical SAM superfamily enzyme YgiQ (UPF0313 family)